MKRYVRKTLLSGLVLTLLATLPGVALAGSGSSEETTTTTTTPEPTTPPVTQVTSVLPVLGSGLTVSLTRDEAGNLTEVALDPAGATIVKEGEHKVVFLLADGDTQVVVKSQSRGKGDEARAGGVKTTVSADATADVTGPGSWSADVFGTGVVTIPYDVAWDGNNPTITIGAVVVPDGVTFEVGEPKVKSGDEKSKFKISVKLSNGDDDARVSFVASARVDDEGETKVKLSVTLDARDHVRCGWGRDHDRDRDRKDQDDDGQVGAASEERGRWSGRGDDDDDDRGGRWNRDDDDHERGDRDRDRDGERGRGDDDEGRD